jgi:hypothetical protein
MLEEMTGQLRGRGGRFSAALAKREPDAATSEKALAKRRLSAKQYYLANPEKVCAATNKWRQANPEKVRAARKRWREADLEANRAKERARKKRWFQADPDKHRATAKKWREANREKVRANQKRWYQASGRRPAGYVNGKWDKYFYQSIKSHKSRNRDGLTVSQLIDLLEKQQYRCALTNAEMTCIRGRGQISTNASIDRLTAGGPYTIDNIQLVCSAVNQFRRALTVPEYIDWCRLVIAHHDQKSTSATGSESSLSVLGRG